VGEWLCIVGIEEEVTFVKRIAVPFFILEEIMVDGHQRSRFIFIIFVECQFLADEIFDSLFFVMIISGDDSKNVFVVG
jgi:hypothetical protein